MEFNVLEHFTEKASKPVYTPKEMQVVYDIVSKYYEYDDIEEFILSSDVEDKEGFIEENDIETLRVCQNCGKFIVEGYEYRNLEIYCSDGCFIDAHGKSTFDNAEEDDLYWTKWTLKWT